MMYYLSDTQESAVDYDTKVCATRHYGSVTARWAIPVYFDVIGKWGIPAHSEVSNDDTGATLEEYSKSWVE